VVITKKRTTANERRSLINEGSEKRLFGKAMRGGDCGVIRSHGLRRFSMQTGLFINNLSARERK